MNLFVGGFLLTQMAMGTLGPLGPMAIWAWRPQTNENCWASKTW